MRLLTQENQQRIWTVEVRLQAHGVELHCPQCPPSGRRITAHTAREAALAHLAHHARRSRLPAHLRTCQCRARGCCWHRRHRGCQGTVRLTLTSDRGGGRWRLADVCSACAAVTAHTAIVPQSVHSSPAGPQHPRPSLRTLPPEGVVQSEAQARVREMLSYLASALPRFCSPSARLLALQCALRADSHGQLCLPRGLLRAMRLHLRTDLWGELEHSGWLCRQPSRGFMQIRLLDASMQGLPGRHHRARAAHWALRPCLRPIPPALPDSARLTALTLAAHTTAGGVGAADMDLLMHLCGHTRQQLVALLDQLAGARLLALWRHVLLDDEVTWQLHLPGRTIGASAVGGPAGGTLDSPICWGRA